MTDSDEKLVKGLRKGNTQALQKIFEKYHHALYFHAYDFVKSSQQAEDLVQEIFIKVWENRTKIKTGLSFKAYLFCITKNHVINHLKRNGYERKAKKEIAYRSLSYHNQAEEQVIYDDYHAFAQKALDHLPPKRKIVFTLHRLEGRKYDEIAVLMNISKNTARDHVVKAEKAIKEYFACQADMIISLLLAIATFIS